MPSRPIRVICSACQVVLREEHTGAKEFAISHGLCEKCYHHFIAQVGVTLDEYIEGLEAPTVAVVGDGRIGAANDRARTMLGKTDAEILGYLGGDVFECRYALLPEGCGRTVHCSGCTIRNTVTDTQETGRAHRDVPAVVNIDSKDENSQQRLLISTEKRGGVVFLSVRPDPSTNHQGDRAAA